MADFSSQAHDKKIYFDNAATSWPKPPQMIEAMAEFSRQAGANPGRAGHRMAIDSARIVYETREAIAGLFHCADPLRVIFTSNVTEAINLGLFGLLKAGDHVITTSMEHNAVMRPLRYLQAQGVDLSIAACSKEGYLDPSDVRREIRKNTRMIVMTHASNVSGTIMPAAEIGRIAHENDLLLMVDAAQTAGVIPIDMQKDHIDLLAFTGHKSLYGPMGTGGLVIGERVDLANFKPLKMGGTGSNSENEVQPAFLPDKFESGTLNVIGLAGLLASLRWIDQNGIDQIRAHEASLTRAFLEGARSIENLRLYGPSDAAEKTSVIPFTLNEKDNGLVGEWIDERYGIFCRVGLHCAPAAARTMGVFPDGTIRFSLGYFNQLSEIDYALEALRTLSER